jgi:dephospho-CoA kinase
MEQGFGEGILTRAQKRILDDSQATFVIYDCIRWQSDMDLVRSYAYHLIVYIAADMEIRWRRVRERKQKRGEEDITLAEFTLLNLRETEKHIKELGSKADFTIVNKKSLDQLRADVADFLKFYALPKSVAR